MKTAKLSDISTPKQWKTLSTCELTITGYPVYGANGVIGYYNEYNHSDSTLMITCRGATCGSLNISVPYSYINGNAMALDNLSPEINIKYLYYYLLNRGFSDVITGSAQPQIVRQSLEKVFISYPELIMQNKIVSLLDKVTDLINKRRKQLEKLDELVKARFVEMFGDPVNNSKQLPQLTLPELGEFGRGVSKHRPRNAPELLGGKYPLIQTGDIANSNLYITKYNNTYSEIGYLQSKMWKAGTLCITIAANIAKTAILTFDSCFPDSVVGFNSNTKTNNIFIHYWFSFFQEILEAQAPESAQKNINLKILNELKIILPPLDLQNQFADFVTQVDKQKSLTKQSLEKLETLKKSLMQEYFG